MNPIIENLLDRKSVRAYEEKPIHEDIKREILLAAVAAPTAGNQQLYTILDITDQNIKDRLAITCDNQPFIAQAPMVLIFCADIQKWFDAFNDSGSQPRMPGAGDLILAVEDAVIAAQNAVTAAWSFGIGSCYIGDIMELCEEHREMLDLPSYVFPAAMLVFGYPTEQQKNRQKPPRCGLQYIVQENNYHRMDGPELRKMFGTKIGDRTYETWFQAFCTRKYNSDFAKEMNRSVDVYLQDFQSD